MGHFASDCRSMKKDYWKGKHHASIAEKEESREKSKESHSEQENRKEY